VSFGPITDLPQGLQLFDVSSSVLPALATLQTASQVGFTTMPEAELVMPNLRVVGDLGVFDDEMTAARFPMLQSVSGTFRLSGASFVDLDMPSVTALGTNVIVNASSLDGCLVLAILAQANYTGPRTLETLPCP
jgi:hypothetical protein